jgi:hypothetical protein
LNASVFRVFVYPRDVYCLPTPTQPFFRSRALRRFALQRFKAARKSVHPFGITFLSCHLCTCQRPPFEWRNKQVWLQRVFGLSYSRPSLPKLFTSVRMNCTLLRFSPYGCRPRPRNQFPGLHSLMHFLALPLQESHRCSRVLTCRELLPVVFHKQSIWPLQPCRSSLNKTNFKRL